MEKQTLGSTTTVRTVYLMDCGRISRETRGFFHMLYLENGFPPFDTTFFPH